MPAKPWPLGAVLLFSRDILRLAELHRWVVAMAPGVLLVEAQRVDDAVVSGGRTRIALAVLDHAGARPLSPLVRLLRRHSPNVKVLVFSADADETPPQVTSWRCLPDRLRELFQQMELAGLSMPNPPVGSAIERADTTMSCVPDGQAKPNSWT